MRRNVFIISGNSNDGKTNWIKGAVEFLINNNFSVGGVVAPGVWYGEEKMGIDSVLLPNEELVHLAVRKPDFSEGYARKWNFNDDVMEKINNYLGNLSDFDYIVIDEIGPLEVIQKQGFTNAIKILEEGRFNNVIVALRPSLVELLKNKIHKDYEVKIIEVALKPGFDLLL